ncbi:MAG: hypothetical protein JWP31_163 [Aeromicrobium sp.]|nr:hypothetical protein [Aeromicrobium sp.]
MATDDFMREANDPATTAVRLQELAQLDRGLWPAIASNPSAYPGLLDWLGEHGDDSVRAAIASRGTSPSFPPPPPVQAGASVSDQTAEIPTDQAFLAQTEAPTTVAPATVPPPFPGETASYGSVPPGGGTTTASGTGSGSSRKKILILAGIAAAVIALIGGGTAIALTSGGDDDDDRRTSQSDAPRDDADEPTAPDLAPRTEAAPDTSGGGDDAEFCATMKKVQEADFGAGGSDPDSFADQFEQMKETYSDLEDSAPAELKSDAQALQDYVDALSKVASGDTTALEDDSDGFVDAIQNLSTYYYQNCV